LSNSPIASHSDVIYSKIPKITLGREEAMRALKTNCVQLPALRHQVDDLEQGCGTMQHCRVKYISWLVLGPQLYVSSSAD